MSVLYANAGVPLGSYHRKQNQIRINVMLYFAAYMHS